MSMVLSTALWLTAFPVFSNEPFLVRDVNPDSTTSVLSNFYATDTLLFFRGYQHGYGSEPWRSDGTTAGTFMIQEMRAGSNSSLPAAFSKLGDDIIFAAANDTGQGLFSTRGNPDDVVLVKSDFVLWMPPMVAVGNELFAAGSVIGPLGGDKELWKTNGTLGGSVRVKDINPGSLASFPEELVAVGNTLYFKANDGSRGVEPWSSDGTGPGTDIVQDIYPGLIWSSPSSLTEINGWLFMAAENDTDGSELWVINPSGALSFIDICPGACGGGAGDITAVGNLAYFRSLGDGSTGAELWRSDGTPPGTWKVKEIGPGTQAAYISHITDLDGTVFFFIADDGVHGLELWRSDGTEPGTRMVKDINESGDGMNNVNSEIVAAENEMYFSADDGVHGFELWRSDGTEGGTWMVAEIDPTGNTYPANLTVLGDRLLFTAHDPDIGYELWGLMLPMFWGGFESGDTSKWSGTFP